MADFKVRPSVNGDPVLTHRQGLDRWPNLIPDPSWQRTVPIHEGNTLRPDRWILYSVDGTTVFTQGQVVNEELRLSYTKTSQDVRPTTPQMVLDKTKTYTFQLEFKMVEGNISNPTLWVVGSGVAAQTQLPTVIENLDGGWKRRVGTLTPAMMNGAGDIFSFSVFHGWNAAESGTIHYRNAMVTEGTVARPWNDGGFYDREVVWTDDTRLTDARPPTAHAGTHAAGGSDPITPAAIGAPTAADLAALPRGLIAYGELTSTLSGITSQTLIAETQATLEAGRRYRLTAYAVDFEQTSPADVFTAGILHGLNMVSSATHLGSTRWTINITAFLVGDGQTSNIRFRINRTIGTVGGGPGIVRAYSNRPAFVAVEDVGPA